MNKEKIDLSKGFVEIYDFGGIKLHAYQNNGNQWFLPEHGIKCRRIWKIC